ncbi:MAG: ROK family protein [Anaerolineales bacterium]|nr:ROK family protein [Anaerolineales bacterium]
MNTLGIDIGGSGIKGALVNTETGELATNRIRIPTPQPSRPAAVIKVIKKLVAEFDYTGPVGIGMPSRILDGVVTSAANIDNSWINFPGQQAIANALGVPVALLNDADVAGMAEMHFGAGRGYTGTVMIFTLGTGIGSAMFVNRHLVPNLELGHIFMRNQKHDAEAYAADRVRKDADLSWQAWGERLNAYFQYMEFLFSPRLFIIGGGVSKKHHKFLKYIDVRAQVVPAELRNEAGIIGAALAAESGTETV